MRAIKLALLGTIPLLAGCGDTAGPSADGNLSISFSVGSGLSASQANGALFSLAGGARQGLMVEGDNGTLEITRIAVIVEEFELEPVDVGDCDDVEPEPVGCEDFEVRYFFIDLPVDGSEVTVLNQNVAAGLYEEVELEIDDLEIDDDDPEDLADAQRIQDLLDRIRAEEGFPNWPSRASMAVVGVFTPKDAEGNLGTPADFATFFRADIEIELEPPTPFEVTDGNNVNLMVNLRPDLWFVQGNDVMDLAALQSEILEFDLEIENGFELEVDDD